GRSAARRSRDPPVISKSDIEERHRRASNLEERRRTTFEEHSNRAGVEPRVRAKSSERNPIEPARPNASEPRPPRLLPASPAGRVPMGAPTARAAEPGRERRLEDPTENPPRTDREPRRGSEEGAQAHSVTRAPPEPVP